MPVTVDSVSKKFCRDFKRSLWYGFRDASGEVFGRNRLSRDLRDGEFWALRDVSFALAGSEALGLIGRNGAGKTTLLRLLNGLMKPDGGRVCIRGRVSAIIELGAGFAPVLTGRENIYVNGAILGMGKRAIDELIGDIIDFAEIAEFIDSPVLSYSEGMKARLGFAVAAQLKPNVMLVDEVLAVGDAGFQRKCLRHMLGYLNKGGALILVSHNMHLIQSVCQRCLVLDRGRIVFDGPTPSAIERYSKLNDSSQDRSVETSLATLEESNPVIVERMEIFPVGSSQIQKGGSMRITLHYRSLKNLAPVTWGFSFWSYNQEVRIATCVAKYAGKLHSLAEGRGQLSCVVKRLPLVCGSYCLKSGIYDIETAWPIARAGWEGSPVYFDVKGLETEAESRHRIDRDILDLEIDWAD